MKKRITVILEYESEDEIDLLDRYIIDDLETELNCCSHFFEIKSIDIEEDKMAVDEWMKDWSPVFIELMKNRVQMSHYKYGSVSRNYRQGNIDAIASMELRIQKYKETGNTENLVDAANFLMFEFMFPQIPGAHFEGTDSNKSPGIVGISEKEMEELKKEDF